MVWKAFLLFGDLCYSSQFAVYMHQNSSGGPVPFSLFLWVLELSWKKEAWNMAKHGLEGVSVVWWFLLILSNLHNLPCICIKKSPTGTFFTFLLVAGNTVEKRKLGTWHNMIWKAFLLFGNYANLLLLPCICIKMAPTGTFFTLLLVAGNKVETRKLRTCQNMAWKGFCCLVIYATLHNLPCICIIMAPAGTFFTFLLVAGNKVEKRKLRTWHNMIWKAFLLFGDTR